MRGGQRSASEQLADTARMSAHDNETPAEALFRLNATMMASDEFQSMTGAPTVLGTGSVPSPLMLLGEQPGEQEDAMGQPFVGPAGQVLDEALMLAGIERDQLYVTNTLKHYKFRRQGSARLHLVPTLVDITRYLPWLEQEIAIVSPVLIVALGKVAARALLSKEIAVEQMRGQMLERRDGRLVVPAYHPSYILRTPDAAMKKTRFQRLVKDLAMAARIANLE
ncbi:UdgX family uracil-DNA binding protein [Novimethylophilus kurashikiensis]|nr:UdgX family uracil-DNA binding protein [Novimethylophilus kurashikiensis]